MRIRLYGGPGHHRMVYLPASTAVAPPEIRVPVMPILDHARLAPLDPELGEAGTSVRYRRTETIDPDGYTRYDWIPV